MISKNKKITAGEREILLVEYEKSQDSAEHFDKTFWNVTSIFIAASFLLLGLAASKPLSDLSQPSQQMICIFGLSIMIVLVFISFDFIRYNRLKYKRCKEIEGLLGMKQHRRTVFTKQPKYLQKHALGVLFTFIAAGWIYLLSTTTPVPPDINSLHWNLKNAIVGGIGFAIYIWLCYKWFDLERQKIKGNDKIWNAELG